MSHGQEHDPPSSFFIATLHERMQERESVLSVGVDMWCFCPRETHMRIAARCRTQKAARLTRCTSQW